MTIRARKITSRFHGLWTYEANPSTINNTSSQWVSLHRWQRVKLEEPTQHFYANRARYHCSILETVPYHIFEFRLGQFSKINKINFQSTTIHYVYQSIGFLTNLYNFICIQHCIAKPKRSRYIADLHLSTDPGHQSLDAYNHRKHISRSLIDQCWPFAKLTVIVCCSVNVQFDRFR